MENKINETVQKKAVIYCRVSTKEQVDEGSSLESQIRVCTNYAIRNGYEIVHSFIEKGESAKTTDRTELQNLLAFCSNKKNRVSAVIIYKVDRLSRNTHDYGTLRAVLKRYGVEIKSTSENLADNPAGRFMENMLATVAQFDNDVRTERSTNGMRDAVRDGRYVWLAPIGYNNVVVAGKTNIVPDPKMAPLIKKMFELIAQDIYTIEEVRLIVTKEGLATRKRKIISKPYFYKMIKNVLYSGWIEKFGERHKGLFEPIVSEALFEQAQRVIRGKGTQHAQHLTDNPDFPLRRFIWNEEGKKVTGSWSTGRSKVKYPFYRFGGKGTNLNRDNFEKSYKEYMDTYGLEQEHVEKLKRLVKEYLAEAMKGERAEADRLRKYISDTESKRSSLIQKNLDGVISDNVLKQQLDYVQKALDDAQTALYALPDNTADFEEIVAFAEEYIKQPSVVWNEAKLPIKLKLQRFQFPQGLTFENNFFGTKEVVSIFNVKSPFSQDDSTIVDPRRFELLTFALQKHCSTS